MPKKWLPLESNPEVMTEFASHIGLDASRYAFHDVLGLDKELLAMVPQPVLAVLLLFPITPESEEAAKRADAEMAAAAATGTGDKAPYYMKQTIGNACGTIAMLHAFGNNLMELRPAEGSFLSAFFAATGGLSAAERGLYLESPPEGAPDIEGAHQAAGEKGSTAPPAPDEDVDLHFICFVEHKGQLYELDGRRSGPICHGPTSRETLLQDVAKVTLKFIER